MHFQDWIYTKGFLRTQLRGWGGGQFSLDALEDGGERGSQNSGLGISSGGGGSSGPQVPNSTTKWAALLRKRDVGSPVPAKSTLNAQTLPSASRPRLTPLAAVPANPLGHRPPARLPSPDWVGAEPGPRVTNLGAPYSATHSSPGAPAEPLLLAVPVPSPTPRALAETYRPGRCPSTGPA